MQAFKFSEEDLAANRQGLLTDRQKQMVADQIRLAYISSVLALLSVLGSILVFVGMAVFAEQGPIPPQAISYLAGTGLILLCIVGTFIFIGLRRLHTLRAEKISMTTGPLRLTTKRFKHGRWTGYYATIDAIRFQLASKQQFEALNEGTIYQIYFLNYPPTHLILSLEEIG